MENKKSHLPEELYAQLPYLLRTPCESYTTPADKELMLVATLTVLSGAIGKYHSTYYGNKIYPTLYTYIINKSNAVLQPLYAAFNIAQEVDKDHLKDYEFTLKDVEKGHLEMSDTENRQFLAPAHLPYSSFVNLLISKKGKLLLHSIGNSFAADSAWSELLDKGFNNLPYEHHITATKKNMHVSSLQLSCLLSGSYQDLQTTIPNTDSLLHSLFNYYVVDKQVASNPFLETGMDTSFDGYYDKLIDAVYELIFEGPVKFVMQEPEQQTFLTHFENTSYTPQEAANCYRIAMILCILNVCEQGRLRDIKTVYCTHEELQQAIAITNMLHTQRVEVNEYLTKNRVEEHIVGTDTSIQELTEEQQLVVNLQEQGMSLRGIAVELYEDEGKFMKVKRMLENIGRAS